MKVNWFRLFAFFVFLFVVSFTIGVLFGSTVQWTFLIGCWIAAFYLGFKGVFR